MTFEQVYISVLKTAFGLSIGKVWQHMSVALRPFHVEYPARVDLFFRVLNKMMNDGYLMLAAQGVFLKGSVDSQLRLLRDVWPASPGDDDLDGFGLWFLSDAPCGAVWISSDGQEIWT